MSFVLLFAVFSPLSTRATEIAKLNLNVQLTSEEQRYLDLKEKLTHCADPKWMPYSKNENGEHIGISSDYVRLFAKTLNIPFEFVPTQSWGETLENAKSRRCDLVAALVDKPDRREYFDFTEGYLDTSVALATRSSAPNIENLKALEGKSIAVVKGYASTTFIDKSFPNLTLIEIDDLSKGLEMLANGEVYGVAGTLGLLAYRIQNHYFESLKVNGMFTDSWKQSVGTRNDEPLLHSIMSKVVSSIPDNTHQHIFSYWLSESVMNHTPTDLTLKELEFIANHPVIRFRIRSNRAPFEYIENGEFKGLAVDYINEISKRQGFKAEYVLGDMSPYEAVEEIRKKERAFDTMVLWVPNEARRKMLHFGDVYLTFPMVVISHKRTLYISSLSDLKHHTVAIEKGYLTNKWLARDYPDINIVSAAHTSEALKMVNDGKVDAYVGNLAVANYMIASGELENIKVASPTEYGNISYHFVAPFEWPELASILSKGYRLITPAEHTAIREKWFTLQRVEVVDYTLLYVVLTAAAILLLASVAWNRKVSYEKLRAEVALEKLKEAQNTLEQKNEELRVLSITDALTGLNNRVKQESTLEYELQCARRYQEHSFGVIMVDIDRFKSINDTYGHPAGDLVLKTISLLFLNNIRAVDSIGRWGGEEFLIICPHADEGGLKKVAEHLRQLLEHIEMKEVGHVTASFGATVYVPEDNSESLISRVDKALYESKANGRNRATFIGA